MKRCLCLLFVGVLLLVGAEGASASNEINGLFDARSLGMGGTGVAFLDSAAAIPTNPALLEQIGKLTLNANAFLLTGRDQRPYSIYHTEPSGSTLHTYETVLSGWRSWSVLPLLGAAYRVQDRVVVGLAAYPVLGSGSTSKYRPQPELHPDAVAENGGGALLLESAASLSVRITDQLSLGANWRATYLASSAKAPLPTPGQPPDVLIVPADDDVRGSKDSVAHTNIDTSGWNLTGYQVGVLYRPISALRIGLSYRSNVVVDSEGHIKAQGQSFPAKQRFYNPASFRGGVAFTAFQDKLLVAGDLKYLMYNVWKTNTVKVKQGTKWVSNDQPANSTNAYNLHFGVEYKLSDIVRIRGGYVRSTTATPPDYALAAMAPPGHSHLVSFGVGVSALKQLTVDTAFAFVHAGEWVHEKTPYNAGPGLYTNETIQLSLSLIYHI
jgi:long-subunit fatty acid transport protein